MDASLHRALKIKAADVSQSVSELINQAVKQSLAEDGEDLNAFSERQKDPLISYEQMLKDLKKHGKI